MKTDRRDTERLVRLLRLGELTAVRVPDEQEEAARDLVRAREDARGDLMRARHRLSKLLLRHGRLYPASAWTKAHAAWLARQRFDQPALALAFEETHAAMLGVRARRDGLDAAIVALASEPRWAAQVGRLCCLRGVSVHTAFALCTEIGDWQRFSGASIGAFLGLVPSESSSGQKRQLGPITKTGNAHARRLLVEAAWHHRRPMRASAELARRRQGQPPRPAIGPSAPGGGCTTAGPSSKADAASARRWSPWPSRGNLPAGAGASPSWSSSGRITGEESAPATREERSAVLL